MGLDKIIISSPRNLEVRRISILQQMHKAAPQIRSQEMFEVQPNMTECQSGIEWPNRKTGLVGNYAQTVRRISGQNNMGIYRSVTKI